MTAKKFIKQILIQSLVLLVLVAAVVFVMDPFFHYHKPWFGLKAVLADKEYQCVGTLRHFDYDSLIVGSSVAENNDNSWFNNAFDCNAIKAIRSYGATADLCYLLDVAYEKHKVENVFYSMDTMALCADPEPTYELTGCPMYLYDQNPLTDVKYLFNKGVLFEKIPYMVAQSTIGDYNPNLSYNWSQWKEFNSDMALGLYLREPDIKPMKEADYYQELLDANLLLMTTEIENHPDTKFHIFFPPYSMLYWDNIHRTGDMEAYLYNMEQAMDKLTQYDNVKVYYFQSDEEIITNLEVYMDTLHFSPEINKYMVDEMAAGTHEVHAGEAKQTIDAMRALAYRLIEDEMPQYEDRIKVDYTLRDKKEE